MKYELMLILKPFLSEEVRERSQNKIQKLIADFGGKIEKTDVWGKRHLAYRIDDHEEGYYILLNVTLSPDKLENLKREFNLTGNILRFLITKED